MYRDRPHERPPPLPALDFQQRQLLSMLRRQTNRQSLQRHTDAGEQRRQRT